MLRTDIGASLFPYIRRVTRFSQKVRRKAETYFRDLRWSNRWRAMNRMPGVFVSKNVTFVSETAKFDLEPCGAVTGGEIHLSAGDRISDGVIFAPWGGRIHLEDNVFIGPYCVLYGHGGIKIGKNTLIAGHSFLVAANHGFADIDSPVRSQSETKIGITIGEDVWVGCGVKILDGVSIGNQCVIGAGAVVTHSLPALSIAVGVPAKIVGKRGR